MSPVISRRTFLQNISVGAAALPWAGGILLAQTGRKVRHASFGASGMALSDIRAFSSHGAFDLVAVADVDLSRAEPVKKLFPNVRVYQDWRELLRKEADNLDSVNVSTPDHMHAPIAMAAMSLGKHVYVQKPLATTVYETRMLAAAAREKTPGVADGHPDLVAPDAAGHRADDSERRHRQGARGAHLLQQDVGRHGSHPVRFGSDSRVARLGHVAGRRREAAVQDGRLSPRQLAQASGLRHRHARRHGLPHLQHAHSWREPVSANRDHLVRPWRRARQLADRRQAQARLPWQPADSRQHARLLVVRRRHASAAGGGRGCRRHVPASGAAILGTDGAILLPHIGAPAAPGRQVRGPWHPDGSGAQPLLRVPRRRARGAGNRCSAGFDYASPSPSVLLGSVAEHYPNQTLAYDPATMRVTNRKEPNGHLARKFRKRYLLTRL